ncbi:MAG TPA: response regulator [bacterium]
MSDSTKLRILFVDDEPNILEGLRRMLRTMRDSWEMEFANSPEEALEILGRTKFDIIVSDMKMPRMTGSELLSKVQEEYPEMVRIALSGEAEKSQIMQSVGPVHQYLSKPCDAETLKSSLKRSHQLRSLLHSDQLLSVTTKMDSLPSLPVLYQELMGELNEPEPEFKNVERIISKDLGMTTKILQLVNSAFFGVRRHVASPGDAVKLLGFDTIESLALSVQVFRQFDEDSYAGLDMEQVWRHSLDVGACAKNIAMSIKAEKRVIDNCFISGILHDIGKAILASRLDGSYHTVIQSAKQNNTLITIEEFNEYGTTHGEIGAYLLGLWGFSDSIIEAIAFHHTPSVCYAEGFTPLAAVHCANEIVYEICHSESDLTYSGIDMEYIESIGFGSKLDTWRKVCQNLLLEVKD